MAKRFLWMVLLWASVPWAHAAGLLVLGDSLSAGYGLPAESGWVSLLGQRLAAEGSPLEVINASVSGETSAGGRSRLPELLQRHKPVLVVIELGGNDGLRGLPLAELKSNLAAMVDAARAAGAKVLLVGMNLPPNYGPSYTRNFGETFAQVAREKQVALVPFLLAGVGGNPELMQADGVHANAKAQPQLLENVWPQLSGLVK